CSVSSSYGAGFAAFGSRTPPCRCTTRDSPTYAVNAEPMSHPREKRSANSSRTGSKPALTVPRTCVRARASTRRARCERAPVEHRAHVGAESVSASLNVERRRVDDGKRQRVGLTAQVRGPHVHLRRDELRLRTA